MRIALVNNFFVPRPSGSAHMTDGLARSLVERGHEVLVLTAEYADAPERETRDGFQVVRLPAWSLPRTKLAMNYDISFTMSRRNYRALARVLDDFAPDLVHQHGQFFDLTWMSTIWARRRRVPTALTVHTALLHEKPVFRAILWLGDMLLARPFLTYGRPRVITIDGLIDNYVRRRYRLPEERMAHIPVGVDPERFHDVDGTEVRSRLDLGDRPVVLSIGHVIPLFRDRLALVRAMPYLLEKRPDVAVVVVGNVYDDRFIHLADELGVRDSLIVTGGVARDEVPAYVAAANVEGHDFSGLGLGTATLEVMAAQVPVVSILRTDAFPGIELRSWENIVIVPPDDPRDLANAIVRLLDDPERARRVGEGQRQLILEQFSIDAITARHIELYESMTGS